MTIQEYQQLSKRTCQKDVYNWLKASNPKPPRFEDIKSWLNEEIDELEVAITEKNVSEQYNAIGDALWILFNFSYFLNLNEEDLNKELDKINKSNWTKFCNSEEDAIKSVELYKLGTHPNKLGKIIDTYYEKNELQGTYVYVIKRTEDNKILKSHLFKDCSEF